ncbi:unnamed protein product [Rhodiola kirilowii]
MSLRISLCHSAVWNEQEDACNRVGQYDYSDFFASAEGLCKHLSFPESYRGYMHCLRPQAVFVFL